MPGTLTAIDISHGTSAQTISQDLAPGVAGAPTYVSTSTYAIGDTVIEGGLAYTAVAAVTAGQDPANNPTLWKQIGTTTPAISGSIYFGSGGSTLRVDAGTVTGTVIDMGAGVNTLTVNGDVNTMVTGAVKDEGVPADPQCLGGHPERHQPQHHRRQKRQRRGHRNPAGVRRPRQQHQHQVRDYPAPPPSPPAPRSA